MAEGGEEGWREVWNREMRGGRFLWQRECAAMEDGVKIEIDSAGQGQREEDGQRVAEEKAEEGHGENRIEGEKE